MALPVSNLVNVVINLSPLAALGLTFNILMIAGDSNVISGVQRARTYTSLSGVAADFGTTAPEYLAATEYFEQVPQPSTLMIGRYLSAATAGQNQGVILTAAQQVLTNFSTVTNGGIDLVIDGSAQNLTGLNFDAVTNLNGVASVVTAALSGGATCVWNGSQFIITSGSTGAGLAASGTITFGSNPANNDTLTIGGTLITFVSASPTGSQVLIGTNAAATAANLQGFLQASVDTNIAKCTYSTSGTVVTVTDKTIGTAGNSFTLAKSSTAITLSGSTLSGGTAPSSVGYATTGAGEDISTLLGLAASNVPLLIPGYAAETPVQCVTALDAMFPQWYGLMFAASSEPNTSQNLAVAAYIEGALLKRTFGITISDTNALNSSVTSDLGSQLKALGYNQTCYQYSSLSTYAIASFFGRYFSVDFSQSNSTIIGMYKQEPGVPAETLTIQQAQTLQAKNYNVFAAYVNSTNIIQYGVVASGNFFDEIQGVDWAANAMQTAVYNLLYTTTTKIPQTDPGVNQVINAVAGVCQQAVANGLAAPGQWNASGFGSLQQGQYLKNGYYIYAQPIALQSQGARAARQCPPIQVALKLAGGIQQVSITLNVNP